jgi:peptidase C39-like protein
MRRAVATLAASLALLSLSAAVSAQRRGGSAPLRPLLDVPYVSQGELLCGGAAAAMLMRAAGARGVYAEDFQSLVDASAGGIHTQALADALRARGYGVHVFNGTAALAERWLAAGRPVLALVEDRPNRFHYVVIVGWDAGRVIFHDPARAPFLARSAAQFDRAWAATDRWMLVVEAPAQSTGATAADDTDPPPPSPEREAATARFLDRDYEAAARLAARAVTTRPADRASWRLLGASRYLSGNTGGALDAWNRAGDPKIDLVRLQGLSRTPHRAIERLIALHPGAPLSRSDLVRADRRLTLLPAREASRVSYVALPGNLAEVRGAVVERPLYPSRVEWIATGARLGIDRELSLSFANVASAGDRLTAAWRFWEGRPGAGLRFGFPSARAGGIVSLSLDWQKEHYAMASPTDVRQALVGWENWVSARLRLSGGAGFARRAEGGRAAVLQGGVEFRPLRDGFAIELASVAGVGSSEPFAGTTARLRWRQPLGAFDLLGDHALAHVSIDAPLDQWGGAGTGIARPSLLRAHPLLRGGRIEGPVFGRTLAQTSVELQRDVARRAFARLAIASFIDVARAWQRLDHSSSALHVDAGVGLRIRLAPGQPAIRIDLAKGLRDGGTALSAGWQVGWSTKPTS